MSTMTAKIDAKKRVSVPAAFRAVAGEQGFDGIFVYPAFTEVAIEGGGQTLIDDIDEMVRRLDPYSAEHNALAAALFSDSYRLPFDQDGRVILPEFLLAHAKIAQDLLFVGMGQKFQIWSPSAFAAWRAQARTLAQENRGLLRSLRRRAPTGDERGGA